MATDQKSKASDSKQVDPATKEPSPSNTTSGPEPSASAEPNASNTNQADPTEDTESNTADPIAETANTTEAACPYRRILAKSPSKNEPKDDGDAVISESRARAEDEEKAVSDPTTNALSGFPCSPYKRVLCPWNGREPTKKKRRRSNEETKSEGSTKKKRGRPKGKEKRKALKRKISEFIEDDAHSEVDSAGKSLRPRKRVRFEALADTEHGDGNKSADAKRQRAPRRLRARSAKKTLSVRAADTSGPAMPGISARTRRGSRALQEIRNYQNSAELLLTKNGFARCVKELATEYKKDVKFQKEAMLMLQTAAEYFVVRLMAETQDCSIHRGAITVTLKDMALANRLRRNKSLPPNVWKDPMRFLPVPN